MKTRLGDIAKIQTGIYGKTVSQGDIVYLQAKHFDENGNIRSILHPDLLVNGLTDKHLLQEGDIIFAAKGSKNFAALYEQRNQAAVASTSFFVIRLNNSFRELVLPGYIVWFLNLSSSQLYLKGRAIGTSIVSISKTVLDEMEISVPSIRTQQTILQVFKLINQEKSLKFRIETLHEQLIQQQLLKAINR